MAALVICPASMRNPWVEEIHKWWSEANVAVVQSKDDWGSFEVIDNGADIVVTSYGHLCDEMPKEWSAIVLDESHFVKNYKAQRSKAVKELCNANPNAVKIALSATPMDKLPDLFNQIDILWPKRLGY